MSYAKLSTELRLAIWRHVDFSDIAGRRLYTQDFFYHNSADARLSVVRPVLARKAELAANFRDAFDAYAGDLYRSVYFVERETLYAFLDSVKERLELNVEELEVVLPGDLAAGLGWHRLLEASTNLKNLTIITLAFDFDDDRPLQYYAPAGACLPPTIRLLRLRMWNYIYRSSNRQPGAQRPPAYLRSKEWSDDLGKFRNIPEIHIYVREYIIWPPCSSQAVDALCQLWTRRLHRGQIYLVLVICRPEDEGIAVQEEVNRRGLTVAGARAEGLYIGPQDSDEDVVSNNNGSTPQVVYDMRRGEDRGWHSTILDEAETTWDDYPLLTISEALDDRILDA